MSNTVSILIPTYNFNAYPLVRALAEQAESIRSDIEILVYDDGSDTRFEDHNRIPDIPGAAYRYFETNLGRSSIRKKLAENASFDWLLFLDADTLPGSEKFLREYLNHLDDDLDAVCGGITYDDHPSKPSSLRYHYGRKREAIPASIRSNRPFMIFTGNLLIRKEQFIDLTKDLPDIYGEDLVISQRIRTAKMKVLHIDNPIVHLGLETSEAYIEKVKELAGNVARLEQQDVLPNDLMRLQIKYHWLRNKGLLGAILWYYRTFEKGIIRNLMSDSPNLRNLDLLKLYHYHLALNHD